MIFTHRQILKLNQTEMEIYQYVIKNIDKVINMSIRELAKETHVSTASIIRFCKKLECDGFIEFKTNLKIFRKRQEVDEGYDDLEAIMEFFNYVKKDEFKSKIAKAIEYIKEARVINFLGIGSSGILGKFGARYFSNIGYFTQGIEDPYYPPPATLNTENLLIVLSESGETKQIIDQVKIYQSYNVKIIAITNKSGSTLDTMADLSINYFINDVILPQTYNISSQIPVIYIIELIARELQKESPKSLPLMYFSGMS